MILAAILILFIISFFMIYLLAKNDFVLLRRNISLHTVFDNVILFLVIGFFVGRLFYIVDAQRLELLHPLSFFHFIKYNGFSLLGSFLGGALGLYFLYRDKKVYPRMTDIYLISFLPFISLTLITSPVIAPLALKVGLILLIVLLLVGLLRLHRGYILKDGSISYIILILLTSYYLVIDFFSKETKYFSLMTPFQVLSLVLFMVFSVLLLRNERIIFNARKR